MADGSAPEMSDIENITRIRVQYAKGSSLRFTGHLDMQRIWERTLRRSGLPLHYSQGFHSRTRLNLASALPLGFTSEVELLDFWMEHPQPLEEVHDKLTSAAPPGLVIKSVHNVDLSEASLQSQMRASDFEVTFFTPQERHKLLSRVNALLGKQQVIRTRRNKTYDLRPLILNLEVIQSDEGETGLWMRLLAEPNATGRPDEVLDALGFENTDYLVCRTQLILGD